ncbi:hypothetical protein CASFOL_041420 [Castilleja foliolosa]|uniref:Methyltransferase PMT27 n=1 Tax=Castilleja foliolosa TaxID=1961234 RepID=A0ABD3BBB1_9LAMI
MASGKSRSSKRSTGISYSTTTILIFIALSLLFLWLLTSNTFSSPQSASRPAPKIKPIAQSHYSEKASLSHEAHHVDHEDIPTHIPDDDAVVQSANEANDNNNKDTRDDTSNDEQETKLENDNEPKTNDNSVKTEESSVQEEEEEKQKESSMTQRQEVEETDENRHVDPEESSMTQRQESAVQEEEEEKQIALKTQTSEESSMTQRQEVEQTDENRHVDSEEIKVDKGEITDEDNQQRVDDHQQREDDQIQTQQKQEQQSRDPNGAISDAQIEHDEAPIETDDTSTSKVKNQEMNHDTLPEKRDEANEDNSKLPKKTKKQWSTQADQSEHEKERRKSGSNNDNKNSSHEYTWQLCNVTAGTDYIPCLDNEKVISKLHSRKHHEHRERHCPDEPPTCLVPLPEGYKTRIEWPQSRDKIWYHNVPHKTLAEVKGHQNWVKVTGEFLTFPGGGTQFIHGALHYIDFLQEAVPDIAWGKHSRVVLDVGCGVASLGGYLFERDVLAMSFAPKDEHEAQVQMALERGIPAISAVMGSQRLPFPSRVFDIMHCARCRVPWHEDGGALLLELNRVLRPGGYFVWSATPVYQKLEEDVQIWKEMANLTVSMCWELVTIKKDTLNSIGAAIYQKPDSNDCYEQRKQNRPPMCKSDDDPNAAWYVPLQSCMHRVPLLETERGSQWPEEWPDRLQTPPYWLNGTQMGIYGKPAPDDFTSDYKHWKRMVSELYMNNLGISWSHVRNVMDMRAVYGGFAAALKDLKVWVMNVVNVDSPDTLPIIYERGLFGIYHDWCESFSTYPRTYDLLHADHLFSTLKKRCNLMTIMAEIDRIVRPGGKLIVREDSSTIAEIVDLLKSLHWEVYFAKNQDGILSAQKTEWRPDSYVGPS